MRQKYFWLASTFSLAGALALADSVVSIEGLPKGTRFLGDGNGVWNYPYRSQTATTPVHFSTDRIRKYPYAIFRIQAPGKDVAEVTVPLQDGQSVRIQYKDFKFLRNSARIRLHVPRSTKLDFNGVPANASGPLQEFVTPPIAEGEIYEVEMRVNFRQPISGRQIIRYKQIRLRRGDVYEISDLNSISERVSR